LVPVITTLPEDLNAIFHGYAMSSVLQYCPPSLLPASANRPSLLLSLPARDAGHPFFSHIFYPELYKETMHTGSFTGLKRLGRCVHHPPPSSAEVIERIMLYLYYPYGSSWPVLGWPLPLHLYMERWPDFISGRVSYAALLVTSYFASAEAHHMPGSQMRFLLHSDWSCFTVIPYAPMARAWWSDVPFFFPPGIHQPFSACTRWLGNRRVRFEAFKPNAWAKIFS
jgi:hypothetical protein